MIAVRIFFAALFACGCFFAAFAWILIPMPLGLYHPEYQFRLRDIVLSIFGCGLAISGYFVWANWLLFAVWGKFYPGNGTGVQIVSFFNHLGWLVFFPFFRRTNIFEFIDALPLEAIWILTNMVIAMIAALLLISGQKDDEQWVADEALDHPF